MLEEAQESHKSQEDRAYFLALILVCITGAGALAAVIAALSAFPGLVAVVSGISAIGLAPVLDDTTFEVHVNPVWGIFVVVVVAVTLLGLIPIFASLRRRHTYQSLTKCRKKIKECRTDFFFHSLFLGNS